MLPLLPIGGIGGGYAKRTEINSQGNPDWPGGDPLAGPAAG